MTPEGQSRQHIDRKLNQAGWLVQDMKQLNLAVALGVAVGVIEAKKDSAGARITAVESQTERDAAAHLKWRKDSTPLRFLFEATGQIIRFTDNADPAPRSRKPPAKKRVAVHSRGPHGCPGFT